MFEARSEQPSTAALHTGASQASATPAPFSARAALTSATTFAGIGAGLVVVNAVTGWGVPCPVLHLTGWLCPFCGATRMGVAVLHGQWLQALSWNPFVLVGLLILALCCLVWIVELIGGPRWRPFARFGGLGLNRVLLVAAAVGVVFMLIRNLA